VTVHLDWSAKGPNGAATVGDPKPCVHCRKPAFLRHPVSGEPVHKMCEQWHIAQRAEALAGERAA